MAAAGGAEAKKAVTSPLGSIFVATAMARTTVESVSVKGAIKRGESGVAAVPSSV